MSKKLLFLTMSILYRHFFPIYRFLYFQYKFHHDNFEISLFKKWLKPGNIVIDVGANIGFYSILFSKLVGRKGQVHCFEPEKLNYKLLKEATKKLKNVIINNLAVSNSNKLLKLYVSKYLNVDHRTYKTEDVKNVYKVKSTTVDNYVKNRLFKVDLVKIDIQGADFFALKGMGGTIAKNPNILVIVEYWPWGVAQLGIKIGNIINFAKKLECKIYVIKDKKINMLNLEIIKKYQNYKKYDFDNWIITRRSLKDLPNPQ